MAQPRQRPPHQFANARRLIVPCDCTTRLHCGQSLTARKIWYVKKYAQTLDGPLFVAGKSTRCHNPACSHPDAMYYVKSR